MRVFFCVLPFFFFSPFIVSLRLLCRMRFENPTQLTQTGLSPKSHPVRSLGTLGASQRTINDKSFSRSPLTASPGVLSPPPGSIETLLPSSINTLHQKEIDNRIDGCRTVKRPQDRPSPAAERGREKLFNPCPAAGVGSGDMRR